MLPSPDKLLYGLAGLLTGAAAAVVIHYRRKPQRALLGARRPSRAWHSKYTHFVISPTGKIQSGWEYAADARDDKREWGTGYKVVARGALARLGLDPSNMTKSWVTAR